ncbi:hypothetical protein [Cyclobacterium amurskyense]|uniref:hypothetical protein n=1 Tax=Cyclobacterium amurskyense TaxID=320787 RepID=UPI00065DCBBE|nr:hypothetical protein [Cyclobacterium amurskyense]
MPESYPSISTKIESFLHYRSKLGYAKLEPEGAGMMGLLEGSPLSNQSIAIRERIVLPWITIQLYVIQTFLDKGKEGTA